MISLPKAPDVVVALVAIAIVGGTGCTGSSSEDTEFDLGDSPGGESGVTDGAEPSFGQPNSGDSSGLDAGGEDVGVSACSRCGIDGAWYEMTAYEVQSIDNYPEHLGVIAFNQEFERDIASGDFRMFFEAVQIAGNELMLSVHSGARLSPEASEGCLLDLPVTSSVASAGGCEFALDGAVTIPVFGGSLSNPKVCAPNSTHQNTIAVRENEVAGRWLDVNCQELFLTVSGKILEADLLDSCYCATALQGGAAVDCGDPSPDPKPIFVCEGCGNQNAFMNLRDRLSFFAPGYNVAVCESSDTQPAACWEATIRAKRVEGPPATCP